MNRRGFVKNAGLVAAGTAFAKFDSPETLLRKRIAIVGTGSRATEPEPNDP